MEGAEVRNIEVARIRQSEDNPRQLFPVEKGKRGGSAPEMPQDMTELVESIRQLGVLQPILVKEAKGRLKESGEFVADGYEVVAGARRLWAAQAAGLSEIPARVVEGDEQTLAAIRLVENLQRKDLNPIEEAQAYKKLSDEFTYSIEEIAESVGKSVAYVRQRFKLVDLPKAAVQAVREGQLSPAIGLLISRIPDSKNREAAAKQIIEGPRTYWNQKKRSMSYVEAQTLVESEYMTLLSEAPFPTDDAALVPAAGACLTCPKRTGQQKDLFADVSKDSCTDLGCYDRKKKAHAARAVEQAKAKGQTVLTPEELKKQMSYGNTLRQNSRYVNLAEEMYVDGKERTWKSILGKEAAATTIGVQEDGRLMELMERSAAMEVFKQKFPKAAGNSNTNRNPSAAAERRRVKVLQETSQRAIAQIVERAAERLPDLEFWRIVLDACCDRWGFDATSRLIKRRGWAGEKAGKRQWNDTRPEKIIKKQTAAAKSWRELAVVLVELIAQGSASYASYSKGHGESLTTLASYYGVDLKALGKKVAQESEKSKKSGAKKKAPAASKSATGKKVRQDKKSGTGKKVREEEQACRKCGCTYRDPCEGGCSWVEPDLCSACA